MNKILLGLISCTILFSSFSQQKEQYFLTQNYSKIVFESNAQFGTIIRHSEKFIPDVTEYTYNFEASISVRTFGDKPWQQKLHYPEIGASFIRSQLGDEQVFGTATALFPHVKFYAKRTKVADLYFRIGTGLAYLPKPYDVIFNPTNNVIGSKINNITQLRFGADFHIHPEVDVVLAGNFTHYSNARFQSPNLGINVPAIVLGFRYAPFKENFKYEKSDTLPNPFKRNEYTYRFSFGINDDGAIGGPKYPVYIHSLQYARYTSIANKVLVGFSFATNIGEYDFLRIQEISTDKNQYMRASDFSIYVGDEILLGKIGMVFLVGAYIQDKEFNSAPLYAKLGFNYYFLEFGKHKHKLFLGANLKTHYSVAEFVEIGGGIAF